MATADLEYRATLNDRAFRQGVTGMQRFADESSRSFVRFFTAAPNVAQAAFGGITAAAAAATKSVLDYAKQNSQVSSQIAEIDRARAGVWRDIGRDISGLLSPISEVVDAIEMGRKALVDFAAAGFGVLFGNNLNDIRAADEQKRIVEGLDREKRQREELLRLQREARIEALEAAGDRTEAARIREQIKLEEQLRRVSILTAGAEKDALIRDLKAASDARVQNVSAGRDRTRSLASGIGGEQVRAVFGPQGAPGGTNSLERQQLEAQRRTNELLQKVVEKIQPSTSGRTAIGAFG